MSLYFGQGNGLAREWGRMGRQRRKPIVVGTKSKIKKKKKNRIK
jgi:hypothetical protein